jgi:hypothetical protein
MTASILFLSLSLACQGCLLLIFISILMALLTIPIMTSLTHQIYGYVIMIISFRPCENLKIIIMPNILCRRERYRLMEQIYRYFYPKNMKDIEWQAKLTFFEKGTMAFNEAQQAAFTRYQEREVAREICQIILSNFAFSSISFMYFAPISIINFPP